MSVSDTRALRYSTTSIVLHWAIAAFIIGEFAWGWWMQGIPKLPPGVRASAYNLHKSIGLCLLALMLFRIAWNATHRAPPLPAMSAWQALAVNATHVLLYVLLILNPLAGFLGSVWSGYPIKWFGLTLPALGRDAPALKDAMSTLHLATGWLLAVLVVLHVAAAIHHALQRDGIMSRMIPGRSAAAAASVPAGRAIR